MSDRAMRAKNERRLDLIEKKYYGGGLDEAEEEEKARLEVEVGDYVARKFPRDHGPIDEFSAWIDRLKAKLEAKRAEQDHPMRADEVESPS